MEGSKVQRQREEEWLWNIEFSNISKDIEIQIRNKESQIEGLWIEVEWLRQSNGICLSNKNQLLDELNALNSHIEIIQKSNFEMNNEIDSIIQRDEMIRSEIAMR